MCKKRAFSAARQPEAPASFVLELGTGGNQQTIQLRLQYPYQGARLLDADLQPTRNRELSLSELLGHRVALASGQPQGQSFFWYWSW